MLNLTAKEKLYLISLLGQFSERNQAMAGGRNFSDSPTALGYDMAIKDIKCALGLVFTIEQTKALIKEAENA